jgi:hypothetical protein
MIRKLVVACAVALATLVGMPAAAQAEPVPTAPQQLDWVLDVTHRLPAAEPELRAHLAAELLAAAGGPAGINAGLARLGPLTLEKVLVAQPDHVDAQVHGQADDFLLSLRVDQAGLIAGLRGVINYPPPASWAQLHEEATGLGARVSFTASEIGANGRCRVVNGINENVQRPLGSAFKLYVLGALGQAVTEHRASWTESLAIRDDWKSLPSGVLQNDPAGTTHTLAEYADKMISISDNTAADHLIHRLGRDAVQFQLLRFGNSRPLADIPFLTTKALFELKGADYPARADAYLSLPRFARPAAVSALERLPLTGITGWVRPEKIDQLEWFGSPADLCRAFSGLRKENQPEIDHALSLNDGGLGLDRTAFPTVWFKGGSEPGVLTLNYLARTAGGRTLVTSVMVSDPVNHLDEDHVAGRGIAIAKGAIALMTQ